MDSRDPRHLIRHRPRLLSGASTARSAPAHRPPARDHPPMSAPQPVPAVRRVVPADRVPWTELYAGYRSFYRLGRTPRRSTGRGSGSSASSTGWSDWSPCPASAPTSFSAWPTSARSHVRRAGPSACTSTTCSPTRARVGRASAPPCSTRQPRWLRSGRERRPVDHRRRQRDGPRAVRPARPRDEVGHLRHAARRPVLSRDHDHGPLRSCSWDRPRCDGERVHHGAALTR